MSASLRDAKMWTAGVSLLGNTMLSAQQFWKECGWLRPPCRLTTLADILSLSPPPLSLSIFLSFTSLPALRIEVHRKEVKCCCGQKRAWAVPAAACEWSSQASMCRQARDAHSHAFKYIAGLSSGCRVGCPIRACASSAGSRPAASAKQQARHHGLACV